MGSTTCVMCTPWLQRHEALCDLPPPHVGMRAPKPCASEPIEEGMGAMPWSDEALDRQLTQNSHGHNAMACRYGAGLNKWEHA